MLKNLKLMRKYQMIIGVLVVFFVIFMVLVNGQLNQVQNEIEELKNDDVKVQQIKDIQKDLLRLDSITSDFISFEKEEKITEFSDLMESLKTRISEKQGTSEGQEYADEYEVVAANLESMNLVFSDEIIFSVKRGLKIEYIISKQTFNKLNEENLVLTDDIIENTILNKENTNIRLTENMNVTKQIVLALIVIATVLSFSLIYFLTKSTSKRLGKIVEINQHITNKKLNVNKLIVKSMDEIGFLSLSANEMIDTLNGIISSMANVSLELLDQGQKVNSSAVEAKTDSGQIQNTMNELSEAMYNQADVLNHIVLNITSLKEEIIKTNTESRELNKASSVLATLSSEGSLMMDQSIHSMEEIDHSVKNAVGMMNELENHTNEITSLTDVINNISTQTNLLSLNAAIEAARAGEAGKGFGVVAGEIRSLAAQVNQSATDIDAIIKSIQFQTHEVTGALSDGYHEVETGTQKIKESAEAYNQINNEANQIKQRANAIDLSLDEIEENSKSVTDDISQISAIAQETSASIEQTVDAVNQQDDILTGILTNADELQNMAKELKSLISDFEL